MRYVIVIEQADSNSSAYTPDVSGALPLAQPSLSYSRQCKWRWHSTLRGCAKRACPSCASWRA